MNRRIWTVAAGLASVAALIAVPSALAAYNSTKLEIQQVGTKLTAKISANPTDDATATALVYAPAGTQLTTSQAPGTVLGPVKALATVLSLGGANIELTGQIVVAAPGQVSPAVQAACTGGATPLATWVMVLQAPGSTFNLPLYLVATTGAATALGPGYVQVCLPPPDIPEGQGGAPLGVKLYSATLSISGVFSPVPVGAWIAFWVPYTPGTGKVNVAGTVATPAAVAPGAVTATAKKKGFGAIVAGRVTQAGQGRGGASVSIFAGTKRTGLKRLGKVSVKANGTYSFRAKQGTFFRATAIAVSATADPLCTALSAALAPIPCINPTVSGFTAQSKVVKKK